MFGILSQQSKFNVMALDTLGESGSGSDFVSSGGSGNISSFSASNTPSNLREFDLSPIQNLRPNQKFGGNLVSDLQSAYQTYITGTPVGRGGQYAVSAQRQYGYETVTQAAAAYLQAAGLRIKDAVVPTIDVFRETVTATPIRELTPVDDRNFPLPTNQTTTTDKNPFELLIDAFTRSFGNAVYNPPLQSQSSGFTGASTDVPLSESAGGSNIGTFIIIGVVGIITYFLYKRFAG